MRKLIRITLLAAVGAVCCLSSAQAQYLRTSYFMDNSTFRTNMNPALRPTRGYFNIPVAGQIGLEYTSNTLTLDKLLYKNPDGGGLVTFLDPSKTVEAQDLLKSLKASNDIRLDVYTNVIGIGSYSGKTFWTFGTGLKVSTEVSLPKGFFEFAIDGNGEQGKTFDLSQLALSAHAYSETYLGFSTPIGDRLIIGAKVKFLGGIADARLHYDKFDLVLNPDRWAVEAKGRLDISVDGIYNNMLTDEDDGSQYYDLGGFKVNDPKGFAGMGAAVDFGATFKVLDNLTLSGAVIDLGAVSWNKSKTISGTSYDNYEFTGFTVGDDNENMGEFSQVARFRPSASEGRTSRLNTTLNIGAEFSILDNFISFGALSSTQFRTFSKDTELTLSGNVRFTKWLTGTLSYSTMNSHFQTVGAALNIAPSWINLFVGTDYVIGKMSKQYIPISQRAGNLYFGLAVPLGKQK